MPRSSHHCLVVSLLVLSAAPLTAQRTATTRSFGLTGGIGNALGWLGIQGEKYVSDRFSIFGGLGYLPSVADGNVTGPTFAMGGRGFTAGAVHRGFLEVSLSQVAVTSFAVQGRRYYGPGAQIGYQLVTRGGFTLMSSIGLGYAPNRPAGVALVQPLGGLSLGYTWRR